jgi:Family of unknown function (DUF6279)
MQVNGALLALKRGAQFTPDQAGKTPLLAGTSSQLLTQCKNRRPDPMKHMSLVRSCQAFALVLCTTLLLQACSSIPWVYQNSPSLIVWRADDYFDFESQQKTLLQNDLNALLLWHRQEELPLVSRLLQDLQKTAITSPSPDQVCAHFDAAQQRLLALQPPALPMLARTALSLTPAQLANLKQAFDKNNSKWKKEWLDVSPQSLSKKRLQRLKERAERFYGRLSPAQVQLLQEMVAASPFDAQRQQQETQRRQRDVMQTLQRLHSSQASEAQAQRALQALLVRMFEPVNADQAAHNERLRGAACASLSQFHQSTSAEQRAHLLQVLKKYEQDAQNLR